MRLGFAGTPQFAADILQALLTAGISLAVVYTQPDRPAGRRRKLQPSPVKVLAQRHKLAVEQPASLRSAEAATKLDSYGIDVLVVAAYGLILPPAILAVPTLGCLNVHASLLPRWRGAAPIERAIMAGDRQTGVCIMEMEKGLDTGPVYAQQTTPITPSITGATLTTTLAKLGGQTLLEVLANYPHQPPVAQPVEGVTYAYKLTPEDSVVDWNQSAQHTLRQIQALRERQPVTITSTTPEGPVRVRWLSAQLLPDTNTHGELVGKVVDHSKAGIDWQLGQGILRVTQLQINRGKGTALSASAALAGYRALFSHDRLWH